MKSDEESNEQLDEEDNKSLVNSFEKVNFATQNNSISIQLILNTQFLISKMTSRITRNRNYRTHPAVAKVVAPAPRFQCALCPLSYKHNYNLTSHCKIKHPEEAAPVIKCQYCHHTGSYKPNYVRICFLIEEA
jgi:hypothetical protein